jgi:hypothetical protein
MAYVKPGVEITQVQKSFSPTLISPDLPAVVIGPAYKVVDAEGSNAYNYGTYTAGMTVTLSGLSSTLRLDASSLYVDLYMISGLTSGARLHIEATDVTGAADNGTTFVIPSGIASASWNGAQVYVGYRALNYDPDLIGSFMTIESLDDIDTKFGDNQVVVDNPLPFALSMALANTRTAVNGVAIAIDEFASVTASGTLSSEHARAIDLISSEEVYALAPLTWDDTTLGVYRAHVDSLSVPTEKRERIAVLNPKITWGQDKATTTRTRRDLTLALGLRRTFYTFPDTCYFKVLSWPVQKLKQAYLASLYSMNLTEYALLGKTYTLASGVVYKEGTPITSTVYAALKADTANYQFDAYIPMPGCFTAACIAGQVSGQFPEQGHTNLPIAGPSKLKYSNDWFTEAQLNTVASGGNYIMTNVGGVISCRHQLSTDMSSIEMREMNITKSLDFTAKFIRNMLVGFIGRKLITPAFLKVLGTIIAGLGLTLVKEGRLNGFKVTGVMQDVVNPDTVLVSIEVQPKYPVNYIKIDLIF